MLEYVQLKQAKRKLCNGCDLHKKIKDNQKRLYKNICTCVHMLSTQRVWNAIASIPLVTEHLKMHSDSLPDVSIIVLTLRMKQCY